MLFFPFRVDLNFNRIPLVTILISLVCILIYIQQGNSAESLDKATHEFCQKPHERTFWMVIKKVALMNDVGFYDQQGAIKQVYRDECQDVFYSVHSNKDPGQIIDAYIDRIDGLSVQNDAINIIYIRGMLEEKYREFKSSGVSNDLTSELIYQPHSYHLGNMITAVFAHADWEHLLGNLFFFFAFAASIEMILGIAGFSLIFISLAIGTHLSYSLAMVNINEALPTLGLSGVVMGMIGVFVYLMPKVNIRCFLWLIVFVKIVRVPAWILALVYIGWDIYNLLASDGQSGINFIAHISGATIGFLLGALFLVERKEAVQAEIRAYLKQEELRLAAEEEEEKSQ